MTPSGQYPPLNREQPSQPDSRPEGSGTVKIPDISLPKGGGAIQSIGEKFEVNAVSGTGSLSVPLALSPGRNGFGPTLALSYNSGSGNSPFGLGWDIGIASITRKTQKGLPRYDDVNESDTFLLSGAEDLVPVLQQQNDGSWQWEVINDADYAPGYRVFRYRPRIEGLFARIERWVRKEDNDTHWRAITGDNRSTIYGQSPEARIHHPNDPQKVFSWLAERSYDDKGNILVYTYKPEDKTGVDPSLPQEKNRLQNNTGFTQKYLKRIFYGNSHPYLVHRDDFDEAGWKAENLWHFQVVFDYGEHAWENPASDEVQSWPVRPDPFSSYRSGFEIRTYRLCKRILMYHFFPEELGSQPYLVASTDLGFIENAVATQVNSIRHWRYEQDKEPETVPPVSFAYTEAAIDENIYTITNNEVYTVPTGNPHHWFDLEGEGLTGILSRYRSAWYYQRNLGDGRFGPKEVVSSLPSIAVPEDAGQQLTDLTGDGKTDLVVTSPALNGYFEMTEDNRWNSFLSFNLAPQKDLSDPNTKLIDLTGDGLPDIMITENDCFLWHASEGKNGYRSAQRVSKALHEEQGPAVVFADAAQTIFLADMSGDGLTDVVRIRNGETCYWPNTGYATFGAKITMNGAPWFDYPETFDPQNIRLGDIDGSGTTDILYIQNNKVSYWINRSGNDWSKPGEIDHISYSSSLTSVELLDLLGNGTACLVWTSSLPEDAAAPIRYIPLMSHLKPYLLFEIDNHMGGLKRMRYTASTRFYLNDRLEGKPWITKLPFPVHVVEHVEYLDQVTGTAFSSRYAYHHGYFDGEEREFRGFGMVEQWDTEDYESFGANQAFNVEAINWQEDSHVPPVLTRTWFHTGVWKDHKHISRLHQREYYQGDTEAWRLSDSFLPGGLTASDQREACRALKGRVLRTEVYGLDRSAEAEHPYSVTEAMYHIRMEQPGVDKIHPVFYVCDCESLSYHYERNPSDPRIAHAYTLEIDRYGNPLKTASIVYPRRSGAVSPEQSEMYITCKENEFIHLDGTPKTYRTGLTFESRGYEIRGLTFGGKWEKADLREAINNAVEVEYTAPPGATPEKRLIGRTRTRYYKNSLDAADPLPWGEADTLAIPYESYQLVFTGDILNQPELGGRITPALLQEGRYRNDIDGDPAHWWIPSGISLFDLNNAQNKFYLSDGVRNPYGQESQVNYDAYRLFPIQTTDPLGNTATARHDYRVLAPRLLTDPNGNRTQAVFDTRGAVMATAMMGKENENDPAQTGDTVENYTPVPVSLNTGGFPENITGEIIADPHQYLQDASSFFYYDLFAWERDQAPSVAIGITRETHASLTGNTPTKAQISLTYSGGMGQELLTKIQAEPGEAFLRDEDGELVKDVNDNAVKDDVATRWVGNGRAILNNKGDPVRQYESYFSSTHAYETESELREYGVSPTLHYDPTGRNIRTDLPDGTFTTVRFTPWITATFDPNDTVLESDWFANAGSPDPAGAEPVNDSLARAAWLAAQHDNTPETAHLDSLGRPFLSIVHNRNQGQDEFIPARTVQDIEENPLAIFDGRGSEGLDDVQVLTHQGNSVMTYVYAMGGVQLYQNSMDGDERWSFPAVDGQILYAWDSRENRFRSIYDALRRPLEQWMMQGGNGEILIGSTVYGENVGNAEALNLRGKVWQAFDQSGKTTSAQFDFKGNPLQSRRRLAVDYTTIIDWNVNDPESLLETETFVENVEYDALNRPVRVETPDGSLQAPEYNKAGLLEKVTATVKGQSNEVVQNIDYDEKGRHQAIRYGNGSMTRYFYDPQTFRLARLLSTRNTGQETLQDIFYIYDPSGNITGIEDHAQDTVFYNNTVIEPHHQYVYDALYRLTEATGRELANGTGLQTHEDLPWVTAGIPHNANLRTYRQRYIYDTAGNILSMQHMAGNNGSWTRDYQYEPQNNMLTQTSVPGQVNTWLSYTHDPHGNMQLPHLQSVQWDFADRIREVDLGGGGTAYYVYGADGGRSRKVIERQGGLIQERIYLGNVEIYRERQGNQLRLERETLHVMEDQSRVAIIETKTADLNASGPLNKPQYRYQYSNHLGSVSLELDEQAQVISYEEYHPYGTTAYRAKHQQIEVSEKHYRYTGKEKDEETGLYYYGARYYAVWIARWTAADPAGLVDGFNLYIYVLSNPVKFFDSSGKQPEQSGLITGVIDQTEDQDDYVYSKNARTLEQIEGMILHDTDSDTVPTFTKKAAAHYVIDKDGRVLLTADIRHAVQHATTPQNNTKLNPENRPPGTYRDYWIGIEIVNRHSEINTENAETAKEELSQLKLSEPLRKRLESLTDKKLLSTLKASKGLIYEDITGAQKRALYKLRENLHTQLGVNIYYEPHSEVSKKTLGEGVAAAEFLDEITLYEDYLGATSLGTSYLKDVDASKLSKEDKVKLEELKKIVAEDKKVFENLKNDVAGTGKVDEKVVQNFFDNFWERRNRIKGALKTVHELNLKYEVYSKK